MIDRRPDGSSIAHRLIDHAGANRYRRESLEGPDGLRTARSPKPTDRIGQLGATARLYRHDIQK
jgi:hypothetical protein